MLLKAKESLRKMLSAATGYYGGLVQSYSLSGIPTHFSDYLFPNPD
jgi:hypothetical protein